MEPIKIIEDLQQFTSFPVKVSIQDVQGGEKAAFVRKMIKKLELCPDRTHIRIYFDDFYFFAVPLTSSVVQTRSEWAAFDKASELNYVIRKASD